MIFNPHGTKNVIPSADFTFAEDLQNWLSCHWATTGMHVQSQIVGSVANKLFDHSQSSHHLPFLV